MVTGMEHRAHGGTDDDTQSGGRRRRDGSDVRWGGVWGDRRTHHGLLHGWLMDQSQNTKLSPDKLRDARERFLALRPVFDQAKDESKGKLTETAMVMEFERAEKARQRLGHVEYFAIVALCDRYADQFRKN